VPKLLCPCGYVHDLSPVPDDGFIVVRDREYDRLQEAESADERLGHPNLESPGWSALNKADALAVQLRERMYECPYCGRLMWFRGDDGRATVYRRE
jgi:hypothetical protein